LPPLVDVFDAAPQLHQTGHSCIVQHFRGANDGRADRAVTQLAKFIQTSGRSNRVKKTAIFCNGRPFLLHQQMLALSVAQAKVPTFRSRNHSKTAHRPRYLAQVEY